MGLAVSLLIAHVGFYVEHICGNGNAAVSSDGDSQHRFSSLWGFLTFIKNGLLGNLLLISQISLLHLFQKHGMFFRKSTKVHELLIF